ncbi:MAG TPA: hypothetical protein VLH79_13590 [Chthonomonadales bacterium]|nr:hypothetical protein [Chthonomonadales bacterium]
MNRLVPASVAAVFLVALIGSAWVLHRVELSDRASADWGADLSVRLRGTVIAAYAGDRREWQMHVESAELRQDPAGPLHRFRSANLEGIRDGALYDARGRQATFRASRAEADGATNAVRIMGAVAVATPEGDRIDAEEAEWDPADTFVRFPRGARAVVQGRTVEAPLVLFSPRYRLIQCPIGAELVDGARRIHAGALFWNVRTGEVECPAGVSVTGPDVGFTARSARINLRERVVRANGVTGWLRMGNGRNGSEAAR